MITTKLLAYDRQMFFSLLFLWVVGGVFIAFDGLDFYPCC